MVGMSKLNLYSIGTCEYSGNYLDITPGDLNHLYFKFTPRKEEHYREGITSSIEMHG